jgi:hypothetical protein
MNRMESMMDVCSELTLAHKPVFDRIFNVLQPEISDLTFTNLFMWQYSYGLKPVYLPDCDYWLLLANPPNKWNPFFLPPLGDWNNPAQLKAALGAMDQLARARGFKLRLRRIPKQLVDALQPIDSSLQFREDNRTFDYIYQASDLIKLEGRKYHGKRNHVNQFQRKYLWEYQRITPPVLEECLAIDKEWFNIKDALRCECADEEKAMALVINNYLALGVSGGVIRVNGNIEAIAVGERLTADMAVIHIEKANTEFDGIYAAINQQFAADFCAGFQLINREEDMGLEGLRKAKNSYNPVRMIEKFNGERKE